MIMSRLRIIFFIFLAITAINLPARSISPSASQKAKARYYYRAGSEQVALTNFGQAMEYFNKAYHLDSLSPEIGLAYAKLQYDTEADSIQTAKVLSLFRRYIDAFPDDHFEAQIYADIAADWGKDYGESARVLEKILKAKPTDTQLFFPLVENYMAMDSLDLALDALARYERAEGSNFRSTTQKVIIAMQRRDTTEAAKIAHDFTIAHPRNADGWLLRGALSQMTGPSDSTILFYGQAEKVAPENSMVKMELTKQYLIAGDTLSASRIMNDFMHGTDIDAQTKLQQLYELNASLFYSKQPREWLVPVVNQLIDTEGGEKDICTYAAGFFESIGKPERSIEILKNIYETDKTAEDALPLMLTYFRADKNAEAAALFESIANTHDTIPSEAYLVALFAYQQLHNYKKAFHLNMDRVRHFIPEYTINMAPQQVKHITDSIAAIDPKLRNDALLWVRSLADATVQCSDTATAYNIYEQALAIAPDDVLTLNNYAYYLARADKEIDKALTLSEAAISAEPDNPTYIDTYAYILFRKKDFSRAELYQKMAIEKASSISHEKENAEYYDHYGDILYMNGNTPEAIENWQKALSLDPDNELIKKKIDRQKYFEHL